MHTSLQTFSLMLEALSELQPEIQAAQSNPTPVVPTLADSLSELGPLPHEALLLGLASDGLPVLLNLHDPHPGPLLVAADPGGGKTNLLHLVARAATEMKTPADVQFGVISNYPEEWKLLRDSPHCMGIFPTYHGGTPDYLSSLSGWAHTKQGGRQSILLLIDDIESMNDLDFDDRQTLRWLLLRGPSRRVWPIATMNTERVFQVEAWLEAFRTRIFGRIRDDHTADKLTGAPGTSLRHLQAGLQFVVQEGREWLKFWVPTIQEEGVR